MSVWGCQKCGAELCDCEPLTHVPKGGMCSVCVQRFENCAELPFATMPVIGEYGDIKIVRCTHFRRAGQ